MVNNIKNIKKRKNQLSCFIKKYNQDCWNELDPVVQQILLWSLLGDGSLKINKGYKNARFSFRHSTKQKDYFESKCQKLKKLTSIKWKQNDIGFGSDKLCFQTKALPCLTYLYEITHKRSVNGKIRIRRKWLNKMTAHSLAIWWCDDGSLVSNTRQGVFCTDGFSLKDIQVLDRYMKKVWGISTSIHKISRKTLSEPQYRLWIRSREYLKKFLLVIAPFIPVKEMFYKVLILYKDSKFQERWISDLVTVLKKENNCFIGNRNNIEEEIRNIIKERKKELNNFKISKNFKNQKMI